MSQRTPGLDTKYFTTHYELICYSTNNKEHVSQLHVVCVTVCPHIKISQIYLKGQRLFWLHFTTRTIWEPEAVFPPFWDTRSVGRSIKKLKANVFEGLNNFLEIYRSLLDENKIFAKLLHGSPSWKIKRQKNINFEWVIFVEMLRSSASSILCVQPWPALIWKGK